MSNIITWKSFIRFSSLQNLVLRMIIIIQLYKSRHLIHSVFVNQFPYDFSCKRRLFTDFILRHCCPPYYCKFHVIPTLNYLYNYCRLPAYSGKSGVLINPSTLNLIQMDLSYTVCKALLSNFLSSPYHS
jgi:hypothetical protein